MDANIDVRGDASMGIAEMVVDEHAHVGGDDNTITGQRDDTITTQSDDDVCLGADDVESVSDHGVSDDGIFNVNDPVGYPDVRGESATRGQVKDLLEAQALAGTIINAMTRFIGERESAICVTSRSPQKPLGYEAVLRYKLKHGVPSAATLQAATFIVAAEHSSFHWTSVVVHLPSLTAVVYDSMGMSSNTASAAAASAVRRVINEAGAMCALRDVQSPWSGETFEVRRMLPPRQQEGSLDCGVCAILGIERIIAAYKGERYEFDTKAESMSASRIAIYRAVTGGSLGNFWPPVTHSTDRGRRY